MCQSQFNRRHFEQVHLMCEEGGSLRHRSWTYLTHHFPGRQSRIRDVPQRSNIPDQHPETPHIRLNWKYVIIEGLGGHPPGEQPPLAFAFANPKPKFATLQMWSSVMRMFLVARSLWIIWESHVITSRKHFQFSGNKIRKKHERYPCLTVRLLLRRLYRG